MFDSSVEAADVPTRVPQAITNSGHITTTPAAAAVFLPPLLLLLCPHSFVPRHNSTTASELQEMVAVTGFNSMDDLIKATVPGAIV